MAVPFSGFEIPPLLYVVALVGGTATVAALLSVARPPVTQRTALAFVPWIVVGATLHVFYQVGRAVGPVYPAWAEPLFAAPAVYLTTAIAMGTVWLAGTVLGQRTTEGDRTTRYLGLAGTGIAVVLLVILARQALGPAFAPRPFLPIVTVIVTGVVTFLVYVLIGLWRTYVMAEARMVGAIVLFAHLLDGISTAVGVDVLGTGERSLVPARIIEFARGLPTEPFIGAGWLFVVVKLFVAAFVVVAFADYVREEPERGTLLLAGIAAVGLGPATNNLLLFFLGLP